MNDSWNLSALVTNRDDLQELFPLPSETIPTRGTQLGTIIKFKTFYLKIYDDQREDAYIVQGFRYHEQIPVFKESVPGFQMRKFASQFTQEDYLLRFQQPCDDPNCLLYGYNT